MLLSIGSMVDRCTTKQCQGLVVMLIVQLVARPGFLLYREAICVSVYRFCEYATLVNHQMRYDTPRCGMDHSSIVILQGSNVRLTIFLPKLDLKQA